MSANSNDIEINLEIRTLTHFFTKTSIDHDVDACTTFAN